MVLVLLCHHCRLAGFAPGRQAADWSSGLAPEWATSRQESILMNARCHERGQRWGKSDFRALEERMIQPMVTSRVVLRRTRPTDRDEVVEHDRPSQLEPTIGRIKR